MNNPATGFALCLLGLAACGGVEEFESTQQAVRNGTVDTTHTNVVLLVNPLGRPCSGVVVSPTKILTAAHCLKGMTSPTSKMDILVDGAWLQSSDVEKHPWSLDGLPSLPNPVPDTTVPGGGIYPTHVDLAVINLSAPLTNVTPAVLATNAGKILGTGTLVGYGRTSSSGGPVARHFGEVEFEYQTALVTLYEGIPFYGAVGSNLHISAGAGNTMMCGGDSGGPIIKKNNKVVAIVSGGPAVPCDSVMIGSTVAVAAFTRWILGGPPHQNPNNKFDVDNDGVLAPKDVLHVVIDINTLGARFLTGSPTNQRYVDVNGDGYVSPSDVLALVMQTNSSRTLTSPPTFPPEPMTVANVSFMLEGDANRDGCVDLGDFNIVSANYGLQVAWGAEDGDFNQDGIVNLGDFSILSGNMGTCL